MKVDFWDRYLAVFDSVHVVARLRDVTGIPPRSDRVDRDCVTFADVPHYIGPRQYISRWLGVRSAVRNAVDDADAVILRVPSQISSILGTMIRRRRRPYGVEVLGDPFDVFAPGSVDHPLRVFFRWHFSRTLRRQCYEATAASYVTRLSLQRRYPPGPSTKWNSCSDVHLPPEAFVSSSRPESDIFGKAVLVTIGSLAALYKAPDVQIDAIADCVRKGLDLELRIIGDGRFRPELEARRDALGLTDRVRFLGQLPSGDAVRRQLDQADLFLLPSKTEGLPRALIEAMARGLPAIGTTVGGIPELLSADDMVPPGNVTSLASKIKEVLDSPARRSAMSLRNLEVAKQYRQELLHERRTLLYAALRAETEAWNESRNS